MSERCIALVTDPPHHLHPRNCTKTAGRIFRGLSLCGVHYRQAQKWDAEGRLKSMVRHWWKTELSEGEA